MVWISASTLLLLLFTPASISFLSGFFCLLLTPNPEEMSTSLGTLTRFVFACSETLW